MSFYCDKDGSAKRSILALVENAIGTIYKKKQDFLLDEFGQKYKASTKQISFIKYLNETIESLIKEGRMGYAISHKDLRRVLLDFREGKDFQFSDIDQAFLCKLEQYCRGKNLKEKTTGIYFRTFRAMPELLFV